MSKPARKAWATTTPAPRNKTEAESFVLAFGKFKGFTLGEVMRLDKKQAAQVGYFAAGVQYVKWLASRPPEQPFLQLASQAARLILDTQSSDDLVSMLHELGVSW